MFWLIVVGALGWLFAVVLAWALCVAAARADAERDELRRVYRQRRP